MFNIFEKGCFRNEKTISGVGLNRFHLQLTSPLSPDAAPKVNIPVSILYKSIADRYRPVRVADGPITTRYRFIKNASWDNKVRI